MRAGDAGAPWRAGGRVAAALVQRVRLCGAVPVRALRVALLHAQVLRRAHRDAVPEVCGVRVGPRVGEGAAVVSEWARSCVRRRRHVCARCLALLQAGVVIRRHTAWREQCYLGHDAQGLTCMAVRVFCLRVS